MKFSNEIKKKITISFLLCLMVSGCLTNAATPSGLKFSTLGCGKPARFSPNAIEINPEWSDGVYEIKVKNQILCSAKIKNPSYKIGENKIINLTYDADISGGASKCYCESSSTFFLTKLPYGNDYKINLRVNYKY